jgi:N-acylglucosamine 2-epimerase
MKRRNFLGTVAGTTVLATGIKGFPAGRAETKGGGGKIGDHTLESLLERYRYDLFDDFLPFMERHVIDHELGGFMCTTDRDGTNISTDKRIWYEGRGTWVYSFLYNNLAREQKYLDVAAKSVNFTLKNLPAEWPWPAGFTREGKPLEVPSDFAGYLFMAEGLAVYSKAVDDKKYWDMAKDIVIRCVRDYDRPDYPDHVTYGPDVAPMPGERVLGYWMVLVWISTQMLEIHPDPDLEKLAERCVEAILDKHYNPDYGLINEVLNHDMSRPTNAFSQFVYTGHVLETLWMVLAAAARIKDKKLFERAAGQFRRHVDVAWDDVYGGVFRCLEHVDQNLWKVDKVLWAQGEVLVGALMIVEHLDAPWAAAIFEKMYDYVMSTYPLKKYGFSLWMEAGDRKMTFREHASRVENYHHPRHLMMNILALERMIKRGGRVSGLLK